MSSRFVILGLAAAIAATPLPAAAQNCYLHQATTYTQKVIGGVPTQCQQVYYVTSASPTSPSGYAQVNVIYNTVGSACAMRFGSITARPASGWSCLYQSFNGSVQVARPPGAW